jgi:tyrosinase
MFNQANNRYCSPQDVTNINKMGYDYAYHAPNLPQATEPEPILRVWGANRSAIRGSFVISTWAKLKDGTEVFLDADAVLSRWNVGGCANCQTHLDAGTHVSLPRLEELNGAKFFSKLHTRDDMTGRDSNGSGLFQHQLGKNVEVPGGASLNNA